MKKIIYVLFVLNIITLLSFANNIKEIFTIGSERDNYIFFSISDVEIDKRGNIYISDTKQSSISKYDKEGKFIKRVGKYGQGPTDFGNRGLKMKLYKNNLYVNDFSNNRINVLNNNLKIIENIKLNGKRFFNEFFVIEDKFVGPVFIPSKDNNKIYVYNMKGERNIGFFNILPDYANSIKRSKLTLGVVSTYSHLIMDYSDIDKEFIITFSFPGKRTYLYFFNNKGVSIKKIDVTVINNYKFPKFLLKYPFYNSSLYKTLRIDSLFFFKTDYILLHYKYNTLKKMKTVNTESVLLIIDKSNGKIINKININEGFRVLKVKNDILYMKNFNDEIEQVHICKIEN